MQYFINGKFNTGEEYQDVANNEGEFKFVMRNINKNFSVHYPNTITTDKGDLLVDTDKRYIDLRSSPKWLVKYFENVFA